MHHEVTLFQPTNHIQNIRHLYCEHFLGSSETAYVAWIGAISRLYSKSRDVSRDLIQLILERPWSQPLTVSLTLKNSRIAINASIPANICHYIYWNYTTRFIYLFFCKFNTHKLLVGLFARPIFLRGAELFRQLRAISWSSAVHARNKMSRYAPLSRPKTYLNLFKLAHYNHPELKARQFQFVS